MAGMEGTSLGGSLLIGWPHPGWLAGRWEGYAPYCSVCLMTAGAYQAQRLRVTHPL